MINPSLLGESGNALDFSDVGFAHFDWQMLEVMCARLAVTALLAGVVAYRPWRRFMPWPFDKTESGAQVLIAVAGALIITVINGSVAIAFALVGLGGFIRFRSGIKDPREAGVMFLMIGIGMSGGAGHMPIALTATAFGFVLLTLLDAVDKTRRVISRTRVRFTGVKDPRQLEPQLRAALVRSSIIRGSKLRLANEEVIIDLYGDEISSAGQVMQILEEAGVSFEGDVSCEEI